MELHMKRRCQRIVHYATAALRLEVAGQLEAARLALAAGAATRCDTCFEVACPLRLLKYNGKYGSKEEIYGSAERQPGGDERAAGHPAFTRDLQRYLGRG